MASIIIEETTQGLNIVEQTTTLKLGEYAVFSGDINDLNQIDTTSLTDGDVLQYNSTSGNFENVADDVLSIEKGSLTKTFTTSEEYTMTLNSAITGVPIVSATKEIAGVTDTDNTWNVETAGGDYDVEDFAINGATLTPSATTGDITLTLGSGAFTSSHVGMTISGNGGVCVLTATDGSATTTTDFTDTSTIAIGSWTMKGLTFDATNGVELSNLSGGGASINKYFPAITNVSGQIDSTYWVDINSMTVTESAGVSITLDLASGSYDSKSKSVVTETTAPEDLFIDSNGTKLYIAGGAGIIYQYTLSTAWDISTASYDSKSKDITAQVATPNGLTLGSSGTKMYIAGSDGIIYQYTLSTAYDVSTASYDSKSKTVSTEDTVLEAVVFKSDGLRMFIAGRGNDKVYSYTLSTAWDVSTASYDSKSLSVAVEDAAPQGIAISSDGTKVFIAGNGNDSIFQYNLSTAWDVSTGSYASKSLDVSSEEITPTGVFINTDIIKAYVCGSGYDSVFQYTIGTSSYAGDAFYSISTDDKTTFQINQSGSTARSIARDNAGTWEYNSNAAYGSTTWTSATANTVYSALSDAMGVTANQMTGSDLEALVDAEYIEVLDTLDLAIILHTSDATVIPSSDGVSVDYTALAAYAGAINGTDYTWEKVSDTQIAITALNAGNYRVRVV